ncbi:MAG: acyl-CoA dehydrogenase family protein [Candidatus Krumholzibacteriia bacterium]
MTTPAGLTPEMCDMVVQTLRQVVRRDLPDERVLALDKAETFPEEFIRTLLSPDVGLHLLFLPESAGGLGGGARDICLVSEEMAGIDLGVATAFLAICLGTDPIIVGGTPEQKSRWLSRIAGEGLIVAYGVTEPAAGSNVAALQTRAEPVRDAAGVITHYRLNGAKQFITNGGVAQLYTILAQAPAGPSFFVVERDTPGVAVGKQEDKHGIRASNTTGVLLEDVIVPADQLIGLEEGKGLRQANAVFGYTRLMVGAFGLGAGQMALDRALSYARSRVQFGSPLIQKQGYTHKLLVPNWIDLAAGRAYVREVALRIDGGEHDLQVEGSIAKLWCTEAGNRAADAALQAFGGYGYTREYMVEKIRRDVRITSIYEGTSEIQQSIIGLFRWKETVRSKGAFYRDAAAALDALQARRPEVGAAAAAAALRALGGAILHCHAAGLTKQQITQFTLADMATAAEVAGAFCRQTAAEADAGAPDAGARAAMSRQCASQALATVRRGALQCVLGQVDPADEAQLAQAAPVVAELAPASSWRTLAGGWRDFDLIADHLRARD